MADVKTDGADLTVTNGMNDDRSRDRALEWQLARDNPVHVLIAGAAHAVEQSLAVLMPHLDPPVCYWTADALLPPPGHVKTLVIRHVDALSAERQRDLSAWLEQAVVAPTRVVSTTTVPLFQRVAAGLFLDALYYRLNTVILNGADARGIDGADHPRPDAAKAALGTGLVL